MLRLELIHTGDCHLGYVPDGLPADRADDFKRSFSRIVDYALERSSSIKLFLIAGDLFDSHDPGRKWVDFVHGELNRLIESGVIPVLIAGTHDGIGYPDSVFRTWTPPSGSLLLSSPTPSEVESLTVGDVPVHFYGMSWNPGASKPPFDEFKSGGEPGFHIAMLHGSLDAAANWELTSRDVPLSLNKLRQTGMDYVALGHYHSVKVHSGRPTVAYCGNIEGKRFGEEGERRFLHVVLEDGADPVVTPVVCGQRVIRDIDVDLQKLALSGEEALIEQLKSLAGERDIVRFTLKGDPGFRLDLERQQAALSPVFYHVELRDRSSFLSDARVLAAKDEISVRGQFVRRMLGLIEGCTDEEEKLKLDAALREGFRAFGGEA